MNEKVTGIVRTAKGGILYYNALGKIISTGSIFDKAAPNPNLQRLGAVVFYSNNSDRTLYGIANFSTSWFIQTPTYTITANLGLNQLMQILAEEVFFLVSGGGGSQDLDSVLTIGNNAGLNDIDLNGQKILNAFKIESSIDAELKLESLGTGVNTSAITLITGGISKLRIPETGNILTGANIDVNNNDLLNVDTITASADLMLNPVGSIDANGKTLNMTLGEIHNVPLIHSQNNTDLTIEGKGTADLVFKTNNVDRLKITDAGNLIFNFFFTVELMAALTVDFYAPFDLKISAITNLVNAPTTTIQDDGVAYVLNATIAAGSKITVTVNIAAVVNLTTTQV